MIVYIIIREKWCSTTPYWISKIVTLTLIVKGPASELASERRSGI